MSTTGNPVLFALRDLGTSVSNIFTADVARSQADLAAQREENTQRRALESLRLSGEQQMAELGIKEAQTRYDITRGERQLGFEGRRVSTEEQRTRDLATFQTGQVTLQQKQLDLATLAERRNQLVREEQIAVAKVQREKEELLLGGAKARMQPRTLAAHLGLAADRIVQGAGEQALPQLGYVDTFLQGLGLSSTTMLANADEGDQLLTILKTLVPQNTAAIAQLGAQQRIAALPEGSPARQQLQRQYDSIFTPPRDRNAQVKTYIEGLKEGVFPKSFLFEDYERVYGGQPQELNYEPHVLLFKTFQDNLPQDEKDKFARASVADKKKLLDEWNEQVRAFRQAHGVLGTSALWLQQARERAQQGRKGTPPPPTTQAPAQEPVLAPILRAGTPEYVGDMYQKRLVGFGDAVSRLSAMGLSQEQTLLHLQPTIKAAINDAIRGYPTRPFSPEDVRRGVHNKEIVESAAVRVLNERFGMERDDARAFLNKAD